MANDESLMWLIYFMCPIQRGIVQLNSWKKKKKEAYMRNVLVEMLNVVNMGAPAFFMKVVSTAITITQVSQLFADTGIMQKGQSITGGFI